MTNTGRASASLSSPGIGTIGAAQRPRCLCAAGPWLECQKGNHRFGRAFVDTECLGKYLQEFFARDEEGHRARLHGQRRIGPL